MRLFFKEITRGNITIEIDEKDIKNTVGSIMPTIVSKFGLEYDPKNIDYRIIVMGNIVTEDILIANFIEEWKLSGKETIHFVTEQKPKQNKWQALCLEKFTSMPTNLIDIITSYSAVRPSQSSVFYSINLTNDIKSNLSLLFKVLRSKFSQYAGRMTAAELLQQLDDTEIQYIIDVKSGFTPLAQQLIDRIEANHILPGPEEDVKQLTNNVFSLVSYGLIPNDPQAKNIEARANPNIDSSHTSSGSII
jgi:hypothetical protein